MPHAGYSLLHLARSRSFSLSRTRTALVRGCASIGRGRARSRLECWVCQKRNAFASGMMPHLRRSWRRICAGRKLCGHYADTEFQTSTRAICDCNGCVVRRSQRKSHCPEWLGVTSIDSISVVIRHFDWIDNSIGGSRDRYGPWGPDRSWRRHRQLSSSDGH